MDQIYSDMAGKTSHYEFNTTEDTNFSEATRVVEVNKEEKKLISEIVKTIKLSDELLEKDISNNDKKDDLVKIKSSMFQIVNNLRSEIKKIEDNKIYNLTENIKENLKKLKENLILLNNMFNKLY